MKAKKAGSVRGSAMSKTIGVFVSLIHFGSVQSVIGRSSGENASPMLL